MKKLRHKFVEYMPTPLEDGVLYISISFGIVSHNCCCGCGNEVVLNLAPRGWQLTYDGESISLYPSIGNWDFKCRSHYWIVQNTVRWAGRWSDKKIEMARELENHSDIQEYIAGQEKQGKPSRAKRGIWAKILGHH